MTQYVKSRVKIYPAKVNQLLQASQLSLRMTAEALMGEVVDAEVIPFDKGTLQNESTFVEDSNLKNGEASIVSDTPYARRLYFHPEYNFNQENNENAGGQWFDPWLENGRYKNHAKQYYEHFFKKYGGI